MAFPILTRFPLSLIFCQNRNTSSQFSIPMLSPKDLQAVIVGIASRNGNRAHAEGWQELDLTEQRLTEIPESIGRSVNEE